MSNAYYNSALPDDLRDRIAEIRGRFAAGTASREDGIALAEHCEAIQLENDDLSVLYATTVMHATQVENELFSRNTEIGDYLANMSHEIRTPLNAIVGYTELVLDEARDLDLVQIAADLQRIAGASAHLLSLINDVLDLSKVEAGRLEILRKPVDVETLVAEVVETFSHLASQGSNALEVQVEPGRLTTDATRLRQILINLVGNALKFTRQGNVLLRARPVATGWEFAVSDDGIGIDPSLIERLFKPFGQVHADTAGEYGGTGLGLALSRRLARAMGGDISVESVANQGSTFTVLIADLEPPDSPLVVHEDLGHAPP